MLSIDKEGHMIKDCPNLKTMREVCSVASEDESDILIVSQPGTIYEWILVDIRFRELFPYMFGEGDV